jgi:hypothetical protein
LPAGSTLLSRALLRLGRRGRAGGGAQGKARGAGVGPAAPLDHARQLINGGASLEEQIAYHQRKASLLSRCAADLDTAEAQLVAAEAWHYVQTLAARRDAPPEETR